MGELLSTGASIAGHGTRITYAGVGDERTCTMTCSCGWSARIESFRHAHSIIECQRRFDRHLVELGIDPLTPRDLSEQGPQSAEEPQ